MKELTQVPATQFVRNVDGQTLLDTGLLRKKLFEDPVIGRRIAKDLGIQVSLAHECLEREIMKKLGQQTLAILPDEIGDRKVFEAAVLSIASNSRSWATVSKNLPGIAEILCDYDVQRLVELCENNPRHESIKRALINLMPGQSQNRDATSILRLAQVLNKMPSLYRRIHGVALHIRNVEPRITPAQLTAALSLALGAPRYSIVDLPTALRLDKIEGMGPALASEFLRNLGWPSFKPDRHIIRLLSSWISVARRDEIVREAAPNWTKIFPKIYSNEKQFLHFAILGEAISPPGESLNQVDQLVWLCGAYLERKGKQSALSACRAGAPTP